MSISVNVNEPSAISKVLDPQEDRTRAKGGARAAIIGLLIAIGLVLFAAANIYLNYLIGPTDLPFLGQFFGS